MTLGRSVVSFASDLLRTLLCRRTSVVRMLVVFIGERRICLLARRTVVLLEVLLSVNGQLKGN